MKFSGPIIKTLACNHTQDNHSDNISGIQTQAIEIVKVFEMEFRSEKISPNWTIFQKQFEKHNTKLNDLKNF